ncbi:MAG: outer membrane protein assembly factor BamB family protein [Planctomycetota bacterium]|jgi:outer membrane protein assembly factor BamB
MVNARTSIASLIALACVLLAGPAAVAGDWKTGVGGNSGRNGLSGEVGPNEAEILWQGSLPAIVAQQAIIDGNLMVTNRIGSFDIPTGTWIVAHDLTTGELLWQERLPYDFPGSSWRSRASAMRDGRVYATRAGNTNFDYLYALDQADGSIIWQSEDLIDEATTESLAFAENGDLIAGGFNTLVRIDADTGDTVWSSTRTCPTTNGCQAAVFGDRAYIWEASPTGPVITAFDLVTGDELYSSEGIGGGIVEQIGPLVGPDGTVYAPRSQNNPVTDFFVALEDTGAALEEKWSVPMGYAPFASFGVGPDGSVYTYSADKEIIRLDPETGDVLDTSIPLRAPDEVTLAARMAIGANGVLYVTNGGFGDGALFSFDPDLTLRWSEPIVGVNVGGPALGPCGILVVCGTGTNVGAYQTPCVGDLDCDTLVGIGDLLALLAAWGPCPGDPEPCPADFDGDAFVGISDLLALLANWGAC